MIFFFFNFVGGMNVAPPLHQPINGPQTPPLVSPSRDVGVDGMVIKGNSIGGSGDESV